MLLGDQAVELAQQLDALALIELRLDPEALTAGATLSQIRATATAAS